MTYAGKYTAGPNSGAVASGTAGSGEADFFLGLPTELGRGVNTGTWGHRDSVYSLYVQDDWRVMKNLTAKPRLRYENTTPWVEVADRQVNFAPFTGEIQYAGKSNYYSNSRALYNSYNWGLDFQPRIGFAYTPGMFHGQVRHQGAYTLSSYLEGTGTNLRLPLNPPLNQEFDTRYDSTNLALAACSQFAGPHGIVIAERSIRRREHSPLGSKHPAGGSESVELFPAAAVRQSTTLQVGYVGQKGTHLAVPMPYAQLV